MGTRARSYPDPCGVARALNLIGGRWALLVVRELLLGPKRFSDLTAGLPAISPNVLSQRLDELTERGVLARREVGPPVSAGIYELTPLGASLEPVLLALARWGSRAAPAGQDGELSTDALILALRTTIRPDRSEPKGRYLLRLGTDSIVVRVRADGLQATRTSAPGRVTATIITDPATLRAVAFRAQPIDDLLVTGHLQISGDEPAARRFLSAFERPR